MQRAVLQAGQRITITEGPGQKDVVNADDFPIVFEVPSDDPTECLLSKGPETVLDWFVCTSPLDIPEASRSEGEYTLRIRIQTDPATASKTEAVVTFTVDLTKPETAISSYSNTISPTEFTFEFESMDDDVDYFECDLDHSGAYQRCRSPKTYNDLVFGQHVFSVRSVDFAGNADDTPATQLFRVDHPSRNDTPVYDPSPASESGPAPDVHPSSPPSPSPSPSADLHLTEDDRPDDRMDRAQDSNGSAAVPESNDVGTESDRQPSPTVVEKTESESMATVIVYVVVAVVPISIIVLVVYLSMTKKLTVCACCLSDIFCCSRTVERTNA